MNILFVCQDTRMSSIASAYFNKMSKKHASLYAGSSVGLKKDFPLYLTVVKCMAEDGYDLSRKKRKQLTPQRINWAGKIIYLAEKKELLKELQNSEKVTLWKIKDAKGKFPVFYVKMRDKIKKEVKNLIEDLE